VNADAVCTEAGFVVPVIMNLSADPPGMITGPE